MERAVPKLTNTYYRTREQYSYKVKQAKHARPVSPRIIHPRRQQLISMKVSYSIYYPVI